MGPRLKHQSASRGQCVCQRENAGLLVFSVRSWRNISQANLLVWKNPLSEGPFSRDQVEERKKDCCESGNDLDCSKLVEVMIESKRYLNAELFHHDFARTVGEAPTFIVELLECLPRKRQISGCDLVYIRKLMMKEPRAQQ